MKLLTANESRIADAGDCSFERLINRSPVRVHAFHTAVVPSHCTFLSGPIQYWKQSPRAIPCANLSSEINKFSVCKGLSRYSLFPRLMSTGRLDGGGGKAVDVSAEHFWTKAYVYWRLVTLFKRKQDRLYILHCALLNSIQITNKFIQYQKLWLVCWFCKHVCTLWTN